MKIKDERRMFNSVAERRMEFEEFFRGSKDAFPIINMDQSVWAQKFGRIAVGMTKDAFRRRWRW